MVPQYIMLTDHEAVAWALWIAHSYVYEQARCLTPILNIQSATKRCGKSQLLRLTGAVVLRPKLSAGISGPAIYRTIEKQKPTLLIDEADHVVSSDKMDLLAVLNAGIEPDAVVTKCVGDTHETKDFSAYCAKVLAGIGCRVDTLEDRSISIVLRRKSQTKKLERVRRFNAADIKQRLQRWAADSQQEIAARYMSGQTDLPEVLNDRQQDCFEILLVIADCAGGNWPETARSAAITICGQTDEVQSLPEALISDLYFYHTKHSVARDSSANICDYLNSLKERPWPDLRRGSGINQKRLADTLKGFGLHSKDVRTPEGTKKGYDFDQFQDVFTAYAGPGATKGDNATGTGNIDKVCRLSVAPVADETARGNKGDARATQKPNETGRCRVVADVAAETAVVGNLKEFTI